MVDGSDAVVQDRLVLRSADHAEDPQGLLVGLERIPVVAAVEVDPAQIAEGLGLAPAVADAPVGGQGLPQVGQRLGGAPQVQQAIRNAQRRGHALRSPAARYSSRASWKCRPALA